LVWSVEKKHARCVRSQVFMVRGVPPHLTERKLPPMRVFPLKPLP
jgi:hypothetical protein